MGLLEWLGIRTSSGGRATAPAPSGNSGGGGKSSGVLSPFQPQGELAPIIIGDIWGPDITLPLSRLDALKIPAVAKGRALLHSLLSRPLVALRDEERLDLPTWLYRSDTGISPQLRMRCIIDDHVFAEASLLAVRRGKNDDILDAAHVPYDRWYVDPETSEIFVDRKPAPAGSVIWIPGPWAGLLVHGADLIRAARDTEKAWTARVRNPFPAMVIKDTEDRNLTKSQRRNLVAAVAAARRDPDNAVFYLPFGLELEAHGADATDLFETGRNAMRLDFANLLNIPAALLDGTVSEASLTYSTQEGRRNELFDYTIPYWTNSIEEALSLDNVVPRGQRIRFDFSDLLSTSAVPTGPVTKD